MIRIDGEVRERFSLPFPPSINNYYAVVRGRKILSSRGRVYQRDAVALLRSRRVAPIEGTIFAHVVLVPPDRRRRDVGNLDKPIFDALTKAGVYSDDSLVRAELLELTEPDPARPRAEIVLYTYEPKPAGGEADG